MQTHKAKTVVQRSRPVYEPTYEDGPQPIESAPKDGRFILVGVPDGPRNPGGVPWAIAGWHPSAPQMLTAMGYDIGPGGWRTLYGAGEYMYPTHWCALPGPVFGNREDFG